MKKSLTAIMRNFISETTETGTRSDAISARTSSPGWTSIVFDTSSYLRKSDSSSVSILFPTFSISPDVSDSAEERCRMA